MSQFTTKMTAKTEDETQAAANAAITDANDLAFEDLVTDEYELNDCRVAV